MGKRLIRILGFLVTVTILSGMLAGCWDTKRVTTSDGKLRFDIPKDWKINSNESNKDANLSVSSNDGVLSFIVIPEEKPKDAGSYKLSDYYKLVGTNLVKSSPKSKIVNPVDHTINEHEAIQFDYVNEVKNVKLSYFFTLIDTKSRYYRLIGWTLSSQYNALKPQLDDIVNSFKVVSE